MELRIEAVVAVPVNEGGRPGRSCLEAKDLFQSAILVVINTELPHFEAKTSYLTAPIVQGHRRRWIRPSVL